MSDFNPLFENRDATESVQRVAKAEKWVREFLVKPHRDLGREGDVCPFVPRALQEKLLWFEPFDARHGQAALADLIRRLRDAMQCRAVGLGGGLAAYLACVVVPYGRPDPVLTRLVDRVKAELKPEFVDRGLMVGEFYPGHPMPGLHNPDFRPLSSPLPLLAMRNMVVTDLLFLAAPQIPPGERLRYLARYQQVMGERLPRRWRARLGSAVDLAERELDGGGTP